MSPITVFDAAVRGPPRLFLATAMGYSDGTSRVPSRSPRKAVLMIHRPMNQSLTTRTLTCSTAALLVAGLSLA